MDRLVRAAFTWTAGTCRRDVRLDQRVAGIADLVLLLAVAVALERKVRRIERRGRSVEHPPPRRDTVVGDGDVERRLVGTIAGERSGMDPGHVRWIEEVVGDVQVVAGDDHV